MIINKGSDLIIILHLEDINGDKIRVADTSSLLIKLFTTQKGQFLSFGKDDIVVDGEYDKLIVSSNMLDTLNCGVIAYTYSYGVYNSNFGDYEFNSNQTVYTDYYLKNTILPSGDIHINGHALVGDIYLTKADLGLDKVSNTSDYEKPLSKAQKEALKNFYTKDEIDAKIIGGGNFDGTLYYTKKEIDTLTVAKEDGKSLIADSEIERLASVDNYDDTEIRTQIANKADASDVYSKEEVDSAIASIDVTEQLADYATTESVENVINTVTQAINAEKLARESADNTINENITSLTETIATKANSSDVYTKAEVDSKISDSGSFDSTQYYNRTEVDSLLNEKADTASIPTSTSQLANDSGFITEHQDISGKLDTATFNSEIEGILGKFDGKVDKVAGKSLISDAEIERLATISNYDDTQIKADIASKANSTDVYTKEEIDSKGYLTEHQDISNLATKDELPTQYVSDVLVDYLDGSARYISIKRNSGNNSSINFSTINGVRVTSRDTDFKLATKDELATKASADSVYTKEEVDAKIGDIDIILDSLNGETV